MQKAKIFVIASHPLGDGFNNTLPYAIYFGCTPIVTDVGDLKVQIEHLKSAQLIQPNNIRQLTKALYLVSQNEGDPVELKKYILDNFVWAKYLPLLDPIKSWSIYEKKQNRLKNILLGILFLILGAIGVIVPIMPGILFFILAIYLFMKK